MDVCEKLNMKYNAHIFLPESAKGTSELTQNAQFIFRGPMLYDECCGKFDLFRVQNRVVHVH